ncbi:MAG TPA: DUF4405 domain-containing protein [Aquabacterium sp.]|nr:DUF4405 domain-containing protein [Aquabacterium sp.]
MQISRDWATPITIGAFLLMATTGILMFFDADVGKNKDVHEWMGWALVVGVGTHVTANFSSFKRYLSKPPALAIVGVFALILLVSFFIPEEDKGGHPARRASQAVLQAPIHDIAPLAHQTPDALVSSLKQAGFSVSSADQTLLSVTGPEEEQQFKALATIFH